MKEKKKKTSPETQRLESQYPISTHNFLLSLSTYESLAISLKGFYKVSNQGSEE